MWTGTEEASSTSGRGRITNVATGMCLGIGGDGDSLSAVQSGTALALYSCDGEIESYDGIAQWVESFFEQTQVNATHGMFHFDHERGPVTGLTWNKTWWAMPFNEANVSQLSVLVAGNGSVEVSSGICQKEGCPSSVESCKNCGSRNFPWSCGMACWNVTGDEALDVPSTLSSVTIWNDWTVTLDETTVVLNRLTIRGRLMFMPDAGMAVELRAHFVRVLGGELIMGNVTRPIEPDTIAILTLHSDRYVKVMSADPRGNTKIYNEKALAINGNFSAYGTPVTAWRRLAAHARTGEREIVLESPSTFGWKIGDELMITSSRPHMTQGGNGFEFNSNGGSGAYEWHTIRNITDDISSNATRVTLFGTLAQDHIGVKYNLTEAQQGFANITQVDMRSAVAHITRNVEIRGGSTNEYDAKSGLTIYEQHYGAVMNVKASYAGWKAGWDATMANAWTDGRETYPDGVANFHYATLSYFGRGCFFGCEGLGHGIFMTSDQPRVTVRGCTVANPLSGSGKNTDETLFTGWSTRQVVFVDNVWYGLTSRFGPSSDVTHLVRNNLFLGDSSGKVCGSLQMNGGCPATKMVQFDDGIGRLVAKNNLFVGHAIGLWLARGCATLTWERNVAMGNFVGFNIEGGCATLPLESYKNSIGVAAHGVDEVAGFLAVESAVGFISTSELTILPTQKCQELHMVGGVPLLRDATVIGVLGQTFGDGFEWECYDRNDLFWGGTKFFRTFDIGYSGVQLGGVDNFEYGNMRDGYRFEMRRVAFVNFTGIDACGRTNAAIANQAAGIVESDGGIEAEIGLATCYPTRSRELAFPHSPLGRGRVTLHDGGAWIDKFGVTLGPEKGHARCYLVDEDGSLLDQVTSRGWMLRSSVDYFWNPDVVADCETYAESHDDDPDFSECMWFLRSNDILLDAATDADRRGMPYNPESMSSRNNCTTPDVALGAASDWTDANVWLCQGVDFLNLKFEVPQLIVSGSEVLWAPITWSTVRSRSIGTSLYDGDQTVATYQESLNVGDAQNGLDRWPQPNTVVLANQQNYRMDVTGDITDSRFFENGDFEFSIFEAQGDNALAPLYCDGTDACDVDDWAVIVNFKFLKSSKILFYHNNLKVDGASRLSQVDLSQPAGYSYVHPTSKVAAFVVRGSGVVKMRALQVVQVTLAIAETFDTFFADNLIDPNAISSEFADVVPPDYSASYDPRGGNIVKENRFVRNLASVLNIDPGRLAVVNIVPGSRRRRRAMATAAAAGEPGTWRRLLDADNSTDDDDDAEGVDLDWTVSAIEDFDDEVAPTTAPTAAANSTSSSSYSDLLSVATALTTAATSGYLDTGCEFHRRPEPLNSLLYSFHLVRVVLQIRR